MKCIFMYRAFIKSIIILSTPTSNILEKTICTVLLNDMNKSFVGGVTIQCIYLSINIYTIDFNFIIAVLRKTMKIIIYSSLDIL